MYKNIYITRPDINHNVYDSEISLELREMQQLQFALAMHSITTEIVDTEELCERNINDSHIFCFNTSNAGYDNLKDLLGCFSISKNASLTLVSVNMRQDFNCRLPKQVSERLVSRLNVDGITIQLFANAYKNLNEYKNMICNHEFSYKVPTYASNLYVLPSFNVSFETVTANKIYDSMYMVSDYMNYSTLHKEWLHDIDNNIDNFRIFGNDIGFLDFNNSVDANNAIRTVMLSKTMPIFQSTEAEMFGQISRRIAESILANCIPIIQSNEQIYEFVPHVSDTFHMIKCIINYSEQYETKACKLLLERLHAKLKIDIQVFESQLLSLLN